MSAAREGTKSLQGRGIRDYPGCEKMESRATWCGMRPLLTRRRGRGRLRRRDVLLVDLDERFRAQAIDVRLVIALERFFARVVAQAIFHRLKRRQLGRQALLDLEDVPAGLRCDRAEDGAACAAEDGFVELREQLAACDFAEVAAFVFGRDFGGRRCEFREVVAGG